MTELFPRKSLLNFRTAFLLALSISLLMNILFLIMFFFGRPPMDNSGVEHVFRLDFTMIRFFANFLFALLLYLFCFNLIKTEFFKSQIGKFIFVVAIIFTTLVLSYLCTVFQRPFDIYQPPRGQMFFGGLLRDFTIAMVVTLSSLLIYFAERQHNVALENERLQAEYMKTRFMAIRNQVDPHFLFNSLNTLNSLIKTDHRKAENYLQQLSFVFRYALQNKEIVSLDEELRFTKAYSGMMQIRYESSLNFIYNIDERYSNRLIIPISLQTLVENAIKHNTVSKRQPLTITVSTTDHDTIRVSNHIQTKKSAEAGEGIGLSNLSERYRLLWNREINIRSDNEIFEVEMPLIEQ